MAGSQASPSSKTPFPQNSGSGLFNVRLLDVFVCVLLELLSALFDAPLLESGLFVAVVLLNPLGVEFFLTTSSAHEITNTDAIKTKNGCTLTTTSTRLIC
jgi:hypothetical protein